MLNRVSKWKMLFVSLLAASLLAGSAWAETHMRMSTTTSTENSGLLKVLLPPFEKAHDCTLDVIAVGTGKALKLGENGDVDVVFVHARAAEDKFVAAGFGTYRKDVMHNDFVLVGPKEDPAGLHQAKTANEAFQRLAEGKVSFISRGDDSGTHKKEKALWQGAAISPSGNWYNEAGQGMGAVLKIADEKRAYALTDRGTFIAYQGKVDLEVVFEGDPALFNPYGIIAVNPEKHPHAQFELAKAFIDYVTSAEGQEIIASYKVNGQQLFYADAIPAQ